MTIEAAERAIAEIVARADKLKADSPWRRSTHGFQIVSDARGVCDVSVCEIRTKGYTEAEQVALADYIEALQPRNARTIAEGFAALKAERDEARRTSIPPHLGDMDAPLRRPRCQRIAGNRDMAGCDICAAIRACGGIGRITEGRPTPNASEQKGKAFHGFSTSRGAAFYRCSPVGAEKGKLSR